MEAKFIKYNDPRKTLGLPPISKKNFQNLKELEKWFLNIFIPDYYNTRDKKEIRKKFKRGLSKGILPYKLYDSMEDIFSESSISNWKGFLRYEDLGLIPQPILISIREKILNY